MSTTQSTCGCATTAAGQSALASEPCACGCCATPEPTKEERIAELHALRANVDRQLAELENA